MSKVKQHLELEIEELRQEINCKQNDLDRLEDKLSMLQLEFDNMVEEPIDPAQLNLFI